MLVAENVCFQCLDSFVCVHVLPDVMQKLSEHQQYPPSASSFFPRPSTKEAGPLCVWQSCSLGSIVKKEEKKN